MKLLKKWLENNKIFFEVFSYIVIGITGIIVSYTQKDISDREFKLNKKQTEPLLKIENEISKSDTTNYYTNEKLIISNEGGPLKNFKEEVKTFYRVEFHCARCSKKIEAYIPINGYFSSSFLTGNFKEIIKTKSGFNNLYHFSKLYNEFTNKSGYGGPYFLEKIVMLKVSYEDLSDEQHTKYFMVDNVIGGYEILEDKYNTIQFKADSLFKNTSYGVDGLTFDKIWDMTHKK